MQHNASSEVDINGAGNLVHQPTSGGHTICADSNGDDIPSAELTAARPDTQNASHISHNDSPRGRKRKLLETSSGKRSRHVSPPWKKVAVEGPTSFIEDGRRKSSRTNTVPLALQPPAIKRQTRAGHLRKAEIQRLDGGVPSPGKHKDDRDATVKRASLQRGAQPIQSVKPPGTHGIPSLRQLHGAKKPPAISSRRSPPLKGEVLHQHNYSDQVSEPSQARQKRRRSPGFHSREQMLNGGQAKLAEQLSPIVFKPIKSLRLNFRRPPLPILNPGNIVHSRRHASLKALLAEDDPLEGEDEKKFGSEEAKNEALIMLELEAAAKPGGLLSADRWTGDVALLQEEPPGLYTHPDYLLKHVIDFQPRLERERLQHVALAKRLAHSALAEWNRRLPKTEQEKAAEKDAEDQAQVKLAHKKMLKELLNQWNIIEAHVRREKMAKYIQEEAAHTKSELKKMLDHSTQLVVERLQPQTGLQLEEDDPGDFDEDPESGDQSASGTEGSDSESEDLSGNTNSDSSEVSDLDGGSDDNVLSRDELLEKYSNLPDVNHSAENETSTVTPNAQLVSSQDMVVANEENDAAWSDMLGKPEMTAEPDVLNPTAPLISAETGTAPYALENVADELLDDSDEADEEDTDEDDDGDDDDDDADDDDDSSEETSSESDGNEDDGAELDKGLLGFYNPVQRQAFQANPSEGIVKVADLGESRKIYLNPQGMEIDESDEKHAIADLPSQNSRQSAIPYSDINHAASSFKSTSEDASRQMSPATTQTGKPSEADSMTSPEPYEDVKPLQKGLILETQTMKTEVSPLLRGDLRIYQHAGVDWLAGMYANRTNGILADEMGLGKTIQTIALLSHLATAHHVWGPHLVVVPTSVMLNWEMEFKKWCPGFKILTYYGTQEERKIKRRGWMDDNSWHVCITSYQLALQDAVTLRRRNWHYMVLDEAHNIKNFRSQRWQTMLNFKTEARLLLTGTPLQNNLTELWSLLFFLEPGQNEQGGFTFADLNTFSKTFHRPVEQILEHGREDMDDEARDLVTKLHKVLRPHLLRRLKADVEKQMPKKYEHIVKCRLSKRQRQLYDGYMGLTGTRESFQSGNYLSIINCLMQLRKVCNHPDLFETRQIVTSYAMPRSAVADYEIRELLVRRKFAEGGVVDIVKSDVMNLWHSNTTTAGMTRSKALAALDQFSEAATRQEFLLRSRNTTPGFQTAQNALSQLADYSRQSRLLELRHQRDLTATRSQRRLLYSNGLLERLTIVESQRPGRGAIDFETRKQDPQYSQTKLIQDMLTTPSSRALSLDTSITKFACITPAVVAPGMDRLALTDAGMATVSRAQAMLPNDPYHHARTRLSIAFPDKSLIQYDCGKLQALDRLLRNLQAGGHRALIFTQMTKVLDILEQFLNLHGHLYLRLDGSTKIEQRQILTDRFNNDTRILAFILSSRSGGLGINLTGADTVIFYDLDWNPAMDKQCQDRCHRIGQTRDVHIYRFVSEGTIEANILRKSNQKRMLDDVVIQEGDFTTDYFNKIDPREFLDDNAEADAALDKVLGGAETRVERVFEQAEDTEDREAAKEAQKEYVHTDEADFEEKTGSAGVGTPKTDAPSTPLATDAVPPPVNISSPAAAAPDESRDAQVTNEAPAEEAPAEDGEDDEPGSHEEYMLRHMTWEFRDVIIKPPSERSRKRAKKGKDHTGIRIRR